MDWSMFHLDLGPIALQPFANGRRNVGPMLARLFFARRVMIKKIKFTVGYIGESILNIDQHLQHPNTIPQLCHDPWSREGSADVRSRE